MRNCRRMSLLGLKSQDFAICTDLDPVTRLELAFKQLQGERIQQLFLHRAFKWARAELRVVAFLGQ